MSGYEIQDTRYNIQVPLSTPGALCASKDAARLACAPDADLGPYFQPLQSHVTDPTGAALSAPGAQSSSSLCLEFHKLSLSHLSRPLQSWRERRHQHFQRAPSPPAEHTHTQPPPCPSPCTRPSGTSRSRSFARVSPRPQRQVHTLSAPAPAVTPTRPRRRR